MLYSSSLGRAAAIVRNRSNILDHVNFQTSCLQCADCSLTAGARALNINFNCLQAMLHSSLGSSLSCGLSSKRSALSGTAEAQTTSAGPGEGVTVGIGNGDNCVVKGGLDMRSAALDVLALTASGANNEFALMSMR